MAIEVPPPVAGVTGTAMLAGGGALALRGRGQLLAATNLGQFASPAQLVPTVRELQTTLAATDVLLDGVQSAMAGARLPGTGLFRRIPFVGAAADDLERAARLGAAAREFAKVDETALVSAASRLSQRTAQLATAVEGDAARLGAAKVAATSGGTKLAVGGALAAAGALLLAATVFDVAPA